MNLRRKAQDSRLKAHGTRLKAQCSSLALVAVFVAAPALAQVERPETLHLTLADAVERAVEHNPDLAIVRLGTEAEAARVGESRSAFAPVFSSTVGRSSNVTPPSNLFVGDRGVDLKDWFSSTGVRQRLPWGAGTWSVSWDVSRTTTNNPISSFDPTLQSGLQIAFSQPLLKDRKIDAARQQYIIAKRNQDSSELRFRESAVQTVAVVKQAYWKSSRRPWRTSPSSSNRSNLPRNWYGKTRSASMVGRFHRSISFRRKPKWRSDERT